VQVVDGFADDVVHGEGVRGQFLDGQLLFFDDGVFVELFVLGADKVFAALQGLGNQLGVLALPRCEALGFGWGGFLLLNPGVDVQQQVAAGLLEADPAAFEALQKLDANQRGDFDLSATLPL